MGRIFKKFTASFGDKTVSDTAQIDSGSDVSILRPELAQRLKIDPENITLSVGKGIGEQHVMGIELPVRIAIDSSAATVTAFVPVATIGDDNKVKDIHTERNLIGADFLQATGAKLDYSRPHNLVFSGPSEFNYFRKEKMTPAMRRLAEECVRRLFGKKSGNGNDEEVARLTRKVRSMMKK